MSTDYYEKKYSMEKIKIVIVDNHQLSRENLCFALNHDERFQVVAECNDPVEVIAIAGSVLPDVVIININEPGFSETEFGEHIKSISSSCAVIGISVYPQISFIKSIMKCGARGYITGSSSREEMIKAIVEVSSGSKYICTEVKNMLAKQIFVEDDEKEGLQSLTRREIQIIQFIKTGLSSKQIAERLMISLHTVQVHRYHILKKLKVKNTASLVNVMSSRESLYSIAS